MKKLEAQYQTKFNHYLKALRPETAAYELKVVRGNTFNISQLQKHQIAALKQVSTGQLVYKIPDMQLGQSPFDCFQLYRCLAYVVIIFDRTKNFYGIPIEKIKKTITEKEAMVLSDFSDSFRRSRKD